MHDTLKYILMLIAIVALQLFFADTLFLAMYVNPLIYISFIILLPMNLAPIATLTAGLGLGIIMDTATGMGGACTATTLLASYLRSYILNIIMGKEIAAEGGMPSFRNPSAEKFMRYAALMTAIQCTAFFCLETMNWSFFHITLLRIILSGIATFIGVMIVTMLFSPKKTL